MKKHLITDTSFKIISGDFLIGPANELKKPNITTLNQVFKSKNWLQFKNTPYSEAPSTYNLLDKRIRMDGELLKFDKIIFTKLNSMAKPGWMVEFRETNKSNDLFHVMFDAIDDFLFVLDSDGNIIKANKAVQTKLNYSHDELQGLNVLKVHPEARREEALKIVMEMLKGTSDFCPVPLLKKDGGLIPVETKVRLAEYQGDTVLLGRSKDLSERVEAAKNIGNAQQKFSASFNDTHRALAIVNLSTLEITEANNTFKRKFLAKIKNATGTIATGNEIFDPIFKNGFYNRMINGGYAEATITLKNNHGNNNPQIVDLKAEVIMADETKFALINAEDVTEKIAAEERLQLSEMRLNLALDASGTGFWDYNIQTNTIFTNEQYGKLLGYKHLSKKQLKTFLISRCHPDDLNALRINYNQAITGKRTSLDIEYRMKHKSGKWVWIHSKGTVVQHDTEGNPLRLAGINMDVTQKHLADEALQYKMQFETLLGSISRSLSNISHNEISSNLNISLQTLCTFLQAKYALIGLINQQKTAISIPNQTFPKSQADTTKNAQGHGINLKWVQNQSRKKLFFNRHTKQLLAESGLDSVLPTTNDLKGLIVVPMMFQSHLKGVIILASSKPIDNKNALLADYLNNIGLVFTNALLYQELEEKKLFNQLQLEKKVKERTRELNFLNGKLELMLQQLKEKNQEIQRFKSLADIANYPVIITSPNLEPLYANPKFTKLFGKPKREEIREFINRIFDRGALNKVIAKFQKLNASSENEQFESLMITKSGSTIPMLVNAIKIKHKNGLPSYLGFTLIDLGEQKKTEMAIHDTMLKFRSLFNEAQDAIVITDENGKITEANPAASKLLGYSQPKLLSFHISDIDDPSDSLPMHKRLEIIKKDKRSFFETIWVTKHREKKPVEINLTSFNLNGTTYLLNHVRDITERRKKETEIHLLWTAIENSDNGIMITDHNRIITYVNPVYCALTGYDKEELLGQMPSILSSGKHAQEFYAQMEQQFLRNKAWKGRLINHKKTGEEFIDETIISPIVNSHGRTTHYVALKRDVTIEVKHEQEALHKEKLAALGTLAGGIAHDFNNILQIILSYNELIEAKVNKSINIEHYNTTIATTCARGHNLVRSLLDFSRDKSTELKPHDLATTVATSLSTIKPLYPSTIIFRENYKTNGRILCDPEQIQQAMLNLFNNSVDSMKGKGMITVSITPTFTGTNELCLSIKDTGDGMDQATLRRIYEPFFTTKPVGQGTGFGIPIVHGIAKRHNARLTVESEINQGTVVHLSFPTIQ